VALHQFTVAWFPFTLLDYYLKQDYNLDNSKWFSVYNHYPCTNLFAVVWYLFSSFYSVFYCRIYCPQTTMTTCFIPGSTIFHHHTHTLTHSYDSEWVSECMGMIVSVCTLSLSYSYTYLLSQPHTELLPFPLTTSPTQSIPFPLTLFLTRLHTNWLTHAFTTWPIIILCTILLPFYFLNSSLVWIHFFVII